MEKNKKLKRGLKDISPLFQTGQPSQKVTPSSCISERSGSPASDNACPMAEDKNVSEGIKCVYVYNPASLEDSFFASYFLASQLVQAGKESWVLKMEVARNQGQDAFLSIPRPALANKVRYSSMHWNQLEEYLAPKDFCSKKSSSAEDSFIFFDYSLIETPDLSIITPLMDKWIMHMQPTFESMMECYRFIKTLSLNYAKGDFYVLLDEYPQDAKSVMVFEKFSEVVSKYLGISLIWLGAFTLSKIGEVSAHELNLEHLFLEPFLRSIIRARDACLRP